VELSAVLDPLFRVPLAAGLLASIVLPVLGNLLWLRDEWLAALGLAHLAAAGALLGLAAGLPALAAAPAGAGAGAGAKALLGARGNTAYGAMILAGWCATLLFAANTRLGDALAHAMVDGQLYFAQTEHLLALISLAVVAALMLPWLTPRLMRARLFLDDEQANRLPAWRWHLAMDLLAALAMALGTVTLGLMGAFALVFVPPWLAFRLAPSWRWAMLLAAAGGLVAYLAAFLLAMTLDQPFGPVLVTALLAEAAGAAAMAPSLARPSRPRSAPEP